MIDLPYNTSLLTITEEEPYIETYRTKRRNRSILEEGHKLINNWEANLQANERNLIQSLKYIIEKPNRDYYVRYEAQNGFTVFDYW